MKKKKEREGGTALLGRIASLGPTASTLRAAQIHPQPPSHAFHSPSGPTHYPKVAPVRLDSLADKRDPDVISISILTVSRGHHVSLRYGTESSASHHVSTFTRESLTCGTASSDQSSPQ
jgi:hypothetical protein